MVAERCLSASLLETNSSPPLQAMDAVLEAMATNEVFVPTHIAVDDATGPAILELACKFLLAGQVLMVLGGYVVRGVLRKGSQIAEASRNPDGTYDMVRPGNYDFAFRPPPQQPTQPPPQSIPMSDDIAVASSVFLALSNSPSLPGNLLLKLDAQAEVETSELPLQERMQIFEDEIAKAKLISIAAGKRPQAPNNRMNFIQFLLDKISHLEEMVTKNSQASTIVRAPMAVNIGTPTPMNSMATPNMETAKEKQIDNLQGLGDSWRQAHGHEDLGSRVKGWAKIAIETGQWPKSQCLNGVLIDVTSMVHAEVQRMKNESHAQKDNNIQMDTVMDVMQQVANTNGNVQMSPISNASTETTITQRDQDDEDEIIAQLALGGSGGGGDDGGSEPSGPVTNNNNCGDSTNGRSANKRTEFALVNPRNINIVTFNGNNVHNTPYMAFNNSIRRLILAQGSDGALLFKVLDKIEALGDTKFTNERFQRLISKYPKVAEFDTAIIAALLNWTIGVANSQVKYGVCNGLDIWRKVYNRYVPLGDDLQNILIRELISIEPVGELEVDTLPSEIDRIIEIYTEAGPAGDLSDKWIRAAIMRNLPEKLTTTLAMDLKRATRIEQMQSIINVYLHDNKIGLPRGMPGTMVCLTIEEETDKTERTKEETFQTNTTSEPNPNGDSSFNAATKGKQKGDGGTGKGHGQCWE